MGRSYHKSDGDDHDRKRVRKAIKNGNRNTERAHLREYTFGNLSEEDYLDMEEEDNGKSKHP
jgi:hypothetical protein